MKKYNVLLVDDEELALRGLKQGIPWQTLQVEEVLTANNMAGAIRILNTHDVDIMITDIEMPGGSGIDLLKWVKKHRENVACVFFTCHADFHYAQEAIRLGVRDYVLKPIPYRELRDLLGRLIVGFGNKDDSESKSIQTDKKEKSDIAEKVKKYILQNISLNIRRQELADYMYMNSDHLSRLIKKETGMSLGDYVLFLKIEVAKDLLATTDLSLVDITREVGFSYSSYFVRIFKNKTGITPQQYRKGDKATFRTAGEGENKGEI